MLQSLLAGMLLLADRNFYGFSLRTRRAPRGGTAVAREARYRAAGRTAVPDGSFASSIYPETKARRGGADGIAVA